jgi:hypothetical protein
MAEEEALGPQELRKQNQKLEKAAADEESKGGGLKYSAFLCIHQKTMFF